MFESIVKENKKIFVYEESMKIGSLGNVLSMDIQKYDTKSKIEIFAIVLYTIGFLYFGWLIFLRTFPSRIIFMFSSIPQPY